MKLRKLSLHSLPGFRRGFEITDISPRLNVIIGPNASGKTSICQAVRRLLWPDRVKHFLFAWIHSEWSYNQDTFTVEVKDGSLAPNISQSGQLLLERLPEEHLISCFSMTIDELFDGKDEEFAQRISREIAGGYDVKAAQKHFIPAITPRTAITDWEAAGDRFEKYKRAQDDLRQEGEGLPALERAIKDAEGANFNVSILDKIIELNRIKNKISTHENFLKSFPQQLIQSNIKATDWDNYEKLLEKGEEINEEFETLVETERKLEKSVGKWREITLAEGELDRQIDCIGRIQGLETKKNAGLLAIKKLESAVKLHWELLGIFKEEDIENIRAEYLENLENRLADLEILDSEISGIREQIRLNDVEEKTSSEAHGQATQLLCELAIYGDIKSGSSWLPTGITLGIVGVLLFLLTDWIRLLALGPLIPLAFLWARNIRNFQRKREFSRRYNELGLSPLEETTPSAIFQQLKRIVKDWSDAHQIDIQLQRKKDLEKFLIEKRKERENLMGTLIEQARQAGINQLPSTRYRFANIMRDLHSDWIKLKEARIDLEPISAVLADEWKQWSIFANLFEESSSNIFELTKIHSRIKKRVDDVTDLIENSSKLEKNKKKSRELQESITKLLTKTECIENPGYLQTLVEQLEEYQEARIELKNLRIQFENLSSELGAKRAARIQEEIENLEKEKKVEQEKAEALTQLSEKNGNLKARIKQMEAATEGNELLRDQNQKFEMLRLACRDFARKELMESLVSEAQKDFQRECQPPVLEKAVEWFQRFTKNKFRLEAPSTHTGSIVYEVIETSTGERRTLDQLSRGTRMQLLMSVRLAFAFLSEGKNVFLPIFLDEVLANTDPERFDAIAEVISELVASGRQIFYLTCNPEDAWKWRQRCSDAHLIDLAKIRGEQAFLAAPLPISKEDFRIPKSSSQNFDEYVRDLKLPAIRIDEPLEMVSVHYLIDTVDDLYRLLESGVGTYGNLMSLKSHLIEKGFPQRASLIARRGQLLERFFDLRTRGRGKPLSREALVEGGLSKTKATIDDIWEIAQEQECNAKKLIEFLEDKQKKDDRKKGLRTEGRESLKNYLSQHGYLDERPILTEDEIRCECFPLTIEEQDRFFIETLLAHTTTKKGE